MSSFNTGADPSYILPQTTMICDAFNDAAPGFQIADRAKINALVNQQVVSGSWDRKDICYPLAVGKFEWSLINWKDPGAYPLTVNGSPTFTAYKGWTGTGTSTDYLSAAYDPSTLSLGMALNDAHIGAFVLTHTTTSGNDAGSTNNNMGARGRNGTQAGFRVTESPTTVSFTGTPSSVPHHIMGTRISSATMLGYDNGALNISSATASAGLPQDFLILKSGAVSSDRQVALAHEGRHLSPSHAASDYAAFLTYLQAVGAVA